MSYQFIPDRITTIKENKETNKQVPNSGENVESKHGEKENGLCGGY